MIIIKEKINSVIRQYYFKMFSQEIHNWYLKNFKILFLIALFIFVFFHNYNLFGDTNYKTNIDSNYLNSPDKIFAQNPADKQKENLGNKLNTNTAVVPGKSTSFENLNSDSTKEKNDIKTNTNPNGKDNLNLNKESIENSVKPAELKKPGVEINKNIIKQPELKNIKTNAIVKPLIINEIKTHGNGLLEIENDDYKYKRIPGISIIKEKRVNDNVEIKIPDAKEIPNKENEKGLFGFKKSTSDILVRIIFFLIIIGIIILFKFRSKTRVDKKIFRRFPGA